MEKHEFSKPKSLFLIFTASGTCTQELDKLSEMPQAKRSDPGSASTSSQHGHVGSMLSKKSQNFQETSRGCWCLLFWNPGSHCNQDIALGHRGPFPSSSRHPCTPIRVILLHACEVTRSKGSMRRSRALVLMGPSSGVACALPGGPPGSVPGVQHRLSCTAAPALRGILPAKLSPQPVGAGWLSP